MDKIKFIRKRDGKIDQFDPLKIRDAILNAVREINPEKPEEALDKIYQEVINKIKNQSFKKNIPNIDDIQKIIIGSSRELGYIDISEIYRRYSEERAEVRKYLAIATQIDEQTTTDSALLIESDSKDSLTAWNREKIVNQLKEEINLSHNYAEKIAKKVENAVIGLYKRINIKKFHTTDIRLLVDLILKEEGLDAQSKKQALLGLPSSDFLKIVFSRSNENSNIASNNPEAVNLEIAERIQKPWALANIFSEEVTNAHLNGQIHIHDLGYPTRVYCSSHSVEYIKKYGLNKILENLESKSTPPNSVSVLNQHVQTFLASMQAHYAGALGFGFLNILYAPLLKRPVEVFYGRLKNNSNILCFEKDDLNKFVEQETFSLSEDEENYFEIIKVRAELREISEKEFHQTAQNLIFAASQNAFSRGGQTLFIDFNVHTGVPNYLKNVPAIGPKGKYMVQKNNGEVVLVKDVPRIKTEDSQNPINGDSFDLGLEEELTGGHIITYGDLEPTAQKFAKAMLEIWKKGDKDGRPFHFPKCDLHIDKNSFMEFSQKEVLNLAIDVAVKNGSVYFMFDRGNGAVLAQCCRLKEKIEDISMLKYPEKLRFCGFQNVTINLAYAAYEGKTLEETFKKINEAMKLALKAHEQKSKFIQSLLYADGSPMRNLGRIHEGEDGPYLDLKKATYIVGSIGLNEAVQALTGKELHESEEAYQTGLKIIAFMYSKIKEFKQKTGLKFTLEETPAESTTRRLAMVDRNKFEMASKVIKGTDKNPYYTNSIHFSPGAEIGIVDRIVGQSKFHDMIESGAIIHAYIGEQRPNAEAIEFLVKKTLEDTRCSQLVFSPTYTECDACGNIMAGEKELCNNPRCTNSSKETLDKRTLSVVTKIVGYNSRVSHWNGSQKQIFEDRKKAEKFYAGENGKVMSWLYSPNQSEKLKIISFGKHNCSYCEQLQKNILEQIKELDIEGIANIKHYYLDDYDNEGLVEAAKYGVPLDTVPSIVVACPKDYWKKTTEYGNESSCDNGICGMNSEFGKTDLIKPEEIKQAIKERLETEFIEVVNFS